MDEILFNAITAYYNILKIRGYHSYADSIRLLVLCFYRDFVYHDYNGILTKEDYSFIEKALNCLFGSTCLIPYPDYLKMGKLHIGETTELARRIKAIEETEVLKVIREYEDKTQSTAAKKPEIKMVKV
jgi:hypothetical protein